MVTRACFVAFSRAISRVILIFARFRPDSRRGELVRQSRDAIDSLYDLLEQACVTEERHPPPPPPPVPFADPSTLRTAPFDPAMPKPTSTMLFAPVTNALYASLQGRGWPCYPLDHAPSAQAPSALVTNRSNNAVALASVCGSAADVPLRLRFARRFTPLSAPLSPLADRRPKPDVVALTDELGDAIPPDVPAVLWCGRILLPMRMPWPMPPDIPEPPFCCPILS